MNPDLDLPEGWTYEANPFSIQRLAVASKLWWRNGRPDIRVKLRFTSPMRDRLYAEAEVATATRRQARRSSGEYWWETLTLPEHFSDLTPDVVSAAVQVELEMGEVQAAASSATRRYSDGGSRE